MELVKSVWAVFLMLALLCRYGYTGISCRGNKFACQNGLKCIPAKRFCDGTKHCSDGSDEILFNKYSNMSARGIPCRRDEDVCFLPNDQVKKKKRLCIKNASCKNNEFACKDGSKCIDATTFCNAAEIDCRDESDEIAYSGQQIIEERECNSVDWLSIKKQCLLPSNNVCDGYDHCEYDVDECLCHDGEKTKYLDEKCFRCLSDPHIVIPLSFLCNHVLDCPDLSDECLCTKRRNLPEICGKVKWEYQDGVNQQFECLTPYSNNLHTFTTEEICDIKSDCESQIDEKNCNHDCTGRQNYDTSTNAKRGFTCSREGNLATKCDKRITCTYEGYEEECKDCEKKPEFCKLSGNGSDYSSFYCPSGGEISGLQICDGIPDCERGEEELNCPDKFYCKSGTPVNVPTREKCNARSDCEDRSDEIGCSFQCNDSGLVEFIDWKKVCDGTVDCKEGGDECRPECITSVFSDTESMIANAALLPVVWIISLIAFIGNIVVAILSARTLALKETQEAQIARINRGLIFNLSIADLLVGIYTITICVKNATQNGKYCYEDREWRCGLTCSALGAIMLIGSEQSVFTLTIITSYRLYSVVRPFSPVSSKLIWVIVGFAWILSCSLALIPLSPLTRDFFIDSIWYKDNELFSIINHTDVTKFTQWLTLTQKHLNESDAFGHIGTWSRLENMISRLHPNYTVHGRFGYYSKHGVCLASFFPNMNTDLHTWIYTLFIVLVNFSSFVFILVGYIIIYINSNSKNSVLDAKKQAKRALKMQKKITRIIVTDFLCWMPICIMAFLQVSGIFIPEDAYIPVGMILIPINSALNPFLYSSAPDFIWEKLKPLRMWINSRCSCLKSGDLQRVNTTGGIEQRTIKTTPSTRSRFATQKKLGA